jgi:hypothetical protein
VLDEKVVKKELKDKDIKKIQEANFLFFPDTLTKDKDKVKNSSSSTTTAIDIGIKIEIETNDVNADAKEEGINSDHYDDATKNPSSNSLLFEASSVPHLPLPDQDEEQKQVPCCNEEENWEVEVEPQRQDEYKPQQEEYKPPEMNNDNDMHKEDDSIMDSFDQSDSYYG